MLKLNKKILFENTIANYFGSAWGALLNFLFIPVYIHYLGIQAWGLIGFFVSLQAVVLILDIGIGSTFTREIARSCSGAHKDYSLGSLVRTFEIVYWGIAFFAGLTIAILGFWGVHHWLHATPLPIKDLEKCSFLMAISLTLRWPSSLYSGGLVGMQKQVLSNMLNAGLNTIRVVGVIAILQFVSNSVISFFIWQAISSLLLSVILGIVLHICIPKTDKAHWEIAVVKKCWRFSMGMLLINLLTTALTQLDKILLAKFVSLEQLGYYTLAGTIAGMLWVAVSPVATAIYPRFVELTAQEPGMEMSVLYTSANRIIAFILFPLGALLIFLPREALFLWTKNLSLTHNTSAILSIIAVGTTIQTLGLLPYRLQLAHGWTSLTIRLNIIMVILLMPLMWVLAKSIGIIGCGLVWLVLNTLNVTLGVLIMHSKLLPKKASLWFFDNLRIGAPVLISAFFVKYFLHNLNLTQINAVFAIALLLIICYAIAFISIPYDTRKIITLSVKSFNFSLKKG